MAAPPVRGTQSFVHTLSSCWQRPSLTGLEVLWRWSFGIPGLLVMWLEANRVLRTTPLDTAALSRMSLLDPVAGAATLAQAIALLLPPVWHVVRWLGPLLGLLWAVAAGLGRTAVLRHADPALHRRPVTLMLLYALRLLAAMMLLAVWVAVLRVNAQWTVNGPLAAGLEPSVVLYCAVEIVATLVLFAAWSAASWVLSAAPLLAMRRDLSGGGGLRAAVRIGRPRGKLIEINLVMGIVKIALIVLAMVFSACPLPFESVTTPAFMAWWYAGVAVLYFVASDFFHVVQLVSYLDLWTAYDEVRATAPRADRTAAA